MGKVLVFYSLSAQSYTFSFETLKKWSFRQKHGRIQIIFALSELSIDKYHNACFVTDELAKIRTIVLCIHPCDDRDEVEELEAELKRIHSDKHIRTVHVSEMSL